MVNAFYDVLISGRFGSLVLLVFSVDKVVNVGAAADVGLCGPSVLLVCVALPLGFVSTALSRSR